MIRIAITPAAFEAIAATLRSVGYELQTNANGEQLIWLESTVVDRLMAMRGPGESYSDVILHSSSWRRDSGPSGCGGALKTSAPWGGVAAALCLAHRRSA